ncbi:MAG: hypothetical protein COT24_03170 [Candidatus Kerfeldbacteria bacterium CG08_land_8_20_14_0_20_40_16]|uniref:Uncharacterized protein n=1 Tax=Candidatus Kerfeldbacteria bacterium CG08_land_8_20_14_0_20_40_16 TaxID=2014244 RepID=A0A2H0YVH0_9BACT|nr:MAG: hypothetical protein COT24_03170 [Candidatus Kerfeldbacteria bacterium CG08_land_8_20_14_0_20_40_16]
MNDVLVSEEMKKQAQEAVQANQVLRSTDRFEVYQMPQGDLDHMALVLFRKGYDADPDEINGNLFIPVEIDGRKGYLLETETAMAYNGP